MISIVVVRQIALCEQGVRVRTGTGRCWGPKMIEKPWIVGPYDRRVSGVEA